VADFVPSTIPPTITCDPPDYFPLVERPDAKSYRLVFSCAPKVLKSITCPPDRPVSSFDQKSLKAVPGRPGFFEVTATCSKAGVAASDVVPYVVGGAVVLAIAIFAFRW
jgi:hypothetical protein